MTETTTEHSNTDGTKRITRRCDSCFFLEVDPLDKFHGCLKGHWEGDDGKETKTDHWKFCKDYKLDA